MAFSDLKKRKHHVISDHNGKLFSAWNGFPANRDCARKYGGGWWYHYINEVCTANWNLNSICPHSGSNCTIQWAKLTPEADKNDPKTFEMKIRPADFSYSPWGSRNFFFGRIFLLNNCLYEIIYQILLQDSVMFSGGFDKAIYYLSGNVIDLKSLLKETKRKICLIELKLEPVNYIWPCSQF